MPRSEIPYGTVPCVAVGHRGQWIWRGGRHRPTQLRCHHPGTRRRRRRSRWNAQPRSTSRSA